MPIYAFACTACGHHFDKLQKLSDADPVACPHCRQAGHVQRQLTAPQFRLAGSGWYETDFKSKSEHRHNLAGDAAGPVGAKVETTAEAKVEKSGSAPSAASEG